MHLAYSVKAEELKHYPGVRFNMKTKKAYVSIGLDIGTSVIKLVKLTFIKDAVEFYGFNLEPIQDDLGSALKRIAESCDIKRVNLSVSGPCAVTRYVNFPRMSSAELKQALKFEAQKHIPFSLPEANLDSFILKEGLPENKMLVLLAAVRKDTINARLKLAEEAGFKINIIDIDSLALVNAFNFSYSGEDILKSKAIALLNIGSSFSNLNIREDGIPRLSRDIQIAGNNFTQKLADTFSIDFKTAEELKLNPDKGRLEKIVAAIDAGLSGLSSELRTSFDYYENSSTLAVAKIFLSGQGSSFPGLKDMLANQLGIEVECWDSLRKINIPDRLDTQQAKAAGLQLAVAVGLALRC